MRAMRVTEVNGAPALLSRNGTRAYVAAEFWAKVEKGEGCWLWRGHPGTRGYGRFAEVSANRAAWYFTHGPIPDGMFVCHRCDNPQCARPDHLFLGTPQDNVRDMDAKGRRSRGERHPSAKLTEAQVREIRSLKGSGLTPTQMGRRFGVDRRTIRFILARAIWKETA